MIQFPEQLDNLSNPQVADKQNSPLHTDQHANANDAIEALEEKVGIDNSEDENSLDYKIRNLIPATPENPETKYLNGNKEWQPIAIGAGGFAGNLYFTNIDSDISTYKKISYTAEEIETILTGSVNNTETLLKSYVYDDALNTTVIDAGLWVSTIRAKVSGIQGNSQFKLEAFVRHANGTEDTLFSKYSPILDNTAYDNIKIESTQPLFNVASTDRLGMRIYIKTTATLAITFSLVIGDGNGSYFGTPLRIRHDQLRDLNGDEYFQHIDATDREKLDNLSGENTGDQDLSGLQELLVSGENIKTVNGESLLGEGDIVIEGGGGASLWTAITGTRVSNTTFTVSGDQTAIFKKGMIVKWKESGVDKWGMVSIPSTYSSPNTTITIIGCVCASGASDFAYCLMGAENWEHIFKFVVAGTIGATATNVGNTAVAFEPYLLIGAELWVGNAGTTNSTTVDININGTTAFTTKPTLATTVASSPTPFTADTAKSFALGDKITIDIDAVQSTPATDLYVKLYVMPSRFLTLS